MAKLRVRRFADQAETQAHYLKEVDRLAEAQRDSVITAAPGQAMTYEAKSKEARRYPDGNSFPWLEGEAEELGLTLQEVVDSVLQAESRWEEVGVAIERKRLQAKRQLRHAVTPAEMHKIVRLAGEDFDTLQQSLLQ